MAEAAKSAEIVLGFVAPGPAVGNVLDGIAKGFAVNTKMVIRVKATGTGLSVGIVLIVGPVAGRTGCGVLRGIVCNAQLAVLSDGQLLTKHKPGSMGWRIEGEWNIVADKCV